MILTTIFIACVMSICFIACSGDNDSSNNDNRNAQIVAVYNMYVAHAESNGETPLSYEDWLASIKGETGATGPQGPKGDKGDSVVTYFGGKAGDNITWTFTSDNVLTFSGEGEMWEYYTGVTYQPSTLVIPWHSIAPMIEKVVIEDGITSICRFAFCGLINLKHIDIPKTVTAIGTCAFEITGVESLDFLNGLNVNITNYMFKECFWLTKVVIPDGVESIGENAFYKASEHMYYGGGKIEYVYIPSSVKYISSSAFSGNPNITFITSLESAPEGWQNGWHNGSNNIYWGYTAEEYTYTFNVNG